MLEALAAIGVVAGAALAAWPRMRSRAAVPVVAASALSLAVSLAALLGDGRESGWATLVETAGLLALVFLALRCVPGRARVRAALLAAAAALAMIPAHETAADSPAETVAGMAVWALGALLAAGAALYLDALDARRARSVADARRGERLALARDLHDFVAHDVSAIVVQAQGARVAGTEREALDALERIEEAGQHALAAMDRSVAALRDAAATGEHGAARPLGVEDLEGLTSRFAAASEARLELRIADGAGDGLPLDVSSTAYRLVSEALTNIRRHAPAATRVTVAVARAGAALTVTVTDGGGGAVARALDGRGAAGGFGLAGLRERVEALGGELRAGPCDRGWQVGAVLPLRDRGVSP